MKRLFISLFFLTYSFQVSADNLGDSNKLFDWAELTYPQYFTPSGTQTITLEDYLVRYYESSDIYLGTLGENVYVYGDEFGGLLFVGIISDFVQITPDQLVSLSQESLLIQPGDTNDKKITWTTDLQVTNLEIVQGGAMQADVGYTDLNEMEAMVFAYSSAESGDISSITFQFSVIDPSTQEQMIVEQVLRVQME